MTDEKFLWHVIVAKPGRTYDAIKDLRDAGLEAFTPSEMRQRTKRAGKGRTERVAYAVPACGMYGFLGVSGSIPWADVTTSKHIIDLLRVQDVPAIVDHGSIARMRALDGTWSTDPKHSTMSPKALRVGDEVVIGGNTWGAVKIQALTKGAVTVSFQAFGSQRQAIVKRADVERTLEDAA